MIKKEIRKQIKKTGTYKVLKLQNKSLKQDKTNLKEHLQRISNDKTDLEKKIYHLKKKNIIQKNNNDNLKNINNNLKNYNINLKKTIDSLKNNNDNLKISIDNLKKIIDNLKNNNDSLKDQLKRSQTRINNNRTLINNLKAENKSLKQVYLETDIPLLPDYNKLTVIMPYGKTDDQVREENLNISLNYLYKIGIKKLIISEHSYFSSEKLLMDKYEDMFDSFRVIFSKSNKNSFNKSHAINNGVMESKTPYFAIFDIDCLTKKRNIDLAINLLDKGFEVVHPFDRVITEIVDKEKFIKEYDFQSVESQPHIREWADGGIVFWKKDRFIDIGMKNEYFCGWGGEDNEILIRARICQLKLIRIDDTLYHLYHHSPKKHSPNNLEERRKMEGIKNKEDLLNEISTWPWVEKFKKTTN